MDIRDVDADDGAVAAAPRPRRAVLRAGVLLVVLAALGTAMLLGGDRVVDGARDRADSWGVWAPVAFAGLYALAEMAFAPGVVLTVSAGALFGAVTGTVTVLVGASAGAALSFTLARWLGRPAVARWAGEGRLARLDGYVSRRGFVGVLVLRLVPLFPFALVNYAAGVTGIRFPPYLAATAVGIVPATVAYTILGGGLHDSSSTGRWVVLAASAGAAALVAAGWWAARRLRP